MKLRSALALSVLLAAVASRAQVPSLINYQGRLLDGTNLYNGNIELVLRLYNTNLFGILLYEDSNSTVAVVDGLYSTYLGDQTSSGSLATALTNAEVWLQVRVNGQVLSPRERLAAVAYASMANGVSTGAITTAMLANSAVSSTKLADNAVTGTKLADGTVSNADLAAGSVGSSTIADGTVAAADVNAASFSNTFWKLDGNAGTTPGTDYLGTSDSNALVLAVNGRPVASYSAHRPPNLVAGYESNVIIGSSIGASILGGGTTNGAHFLSSSSFATIGGGLSNRISAADYGTIGGGDHNIIDVLPLGGVPVRSVISGGSSNTIGAQQSFIGGGDNNLIEGSFGQTIAGGKDNHTATRYAAIAGGRDNYVTNTAGSSLGGGAIGGGQENRVVADYGTVGGGYRNSALGYYCVVAGGLSNTVEASYAVSGGGMSNRVDGYSAVVAGGSWNTASGYYAVVAGGALNQSPSNYAAVAGGFRNSANGRGASIGGGFFNNVIGDYSSVAGGYSNTITTPGNAFIGGGTLNVAGDESSVVGGGEGNTAAGFASFIGGGRFNAATSFYGVVSGGKSNQALADRSFVGGGEQNIIHGFAGVAAGGVTNTASGDYAVVPGGRGNTAEGDYSLAAGRTARALHRGSFVWADSTPGAFASTMTDQFAMRASNGLWVSSQAGSSKTVSFGVRFEDNAVVAWGKVTKAGSILGSESFNILSVTNTAEGRYEIDLRSTGASSGELVPVATPEIDGQPSGAAAVRFIAVDQVSANQFNVYINNGTFAPTNNDFTIIVTGR